MINIYDGNAVMLRDLLSPKLPGGTRLTIRQRLASATASDIWVWDGPRHNERRQAVYPKYKVGRPPLAEDVFAQINLFKDLLVHTPATQITVDGWEADDCVNTLVKRHNGPITVHTTDEDYVQLLRQPNVTINGVKKRSCDPEWICLYKALVGDKSDKIDGIPGFGPKAWEDTSPYRAELAAAIATGSPHSFHQLPLSKALLRWIDLPGNVELLQSMFLITHMWEVPEEELNQGVSIGKPNSTIIEQTLKKFFL